MRRIMVLAMAAALAIGAVGVTAAAAAGPVVGDWVYNPANGHSYAQVEGVTWADAEALARTLHGHLVAIKDQVENDWLVAAFPEPWRWIGLNDRDQDGVWTWSSGEKVTYQNWRDGAPDDWKGYDPLGEHVATLTSDTDQRWEDISERWVGQGIIEVATRVKDPKPNRLPVGTHDGSVDEWAVGDACYANGWAWDPDSAKRDVTVRILAMRLDLTKVPIEIWRGPAADFRDDLLTAGFGDGTASFWVDLRPLIEYGIPYQIRVQGQDLQTGTWTDLDSTPRLITCEP